MDLAGRYLNLAMEGKKRADYPLQGFTTEYSGPLHESEHSGQRMETMGDVNLLLFLAIQDHQHLHLQVKDQALPM